MALPGLLQCDKQGCHASQSTMHLVETCYERPAIHSTMTKHLHVLHKHAASDAPHDRRQIDMSKYSPSPVAAITHVLLFQLFQIAFDKSLQARNAAAPHDMQSACAHLQPLWLGLCRQQVSLVGSHYQAPLLLH